MSRSNPPRWSEATWSLCVCVRGEGGGGVADIHLGIIQFKFVVSLRRGIIRWREDQLTPKSLPPGRWCKGGQSQRLLQRSSLQRSLQSVNRSCQSVFVFELKQNLFSETPCPILCELGFWRSSGTASAHFILFVKI